MDYLRKRTISCWILFLCLSVFLKTVLCGQVVEFPAKQGYLNSTLSITCRYSLETTESLNNVRIQKFINGQFLDIVTFQSSGQNGICYYNPAGAYLQGRSNCTILLQNNLATLVLEALECQDEAQYKCILGYFRSGENILQTHESSAKQLTVQGRPQQPSVIKKEPSEIAENEELKFTCVAVVGKSPIGGIEWQKVAPGTASTEDLGSGIDSLTDTPGSCTKTMTSVFTLNVKAEDNGFRIRCRTTHPNLEDSSHFRDSSELTVYYPVKDEITVLQNPNIPTQTEGERVSLRCSVTSVPAASIRWRHDETNTTYTTENGEYVFTRIQMENAGTYTCEASNSYFNQTYTASKSLLINVAKPTTPGSSSSSGSTSTEPIGGPTDSTLKGGNDDETLIIIIVCVVVGLVIIAAIIAFVIFRKRRNEKIKSQKIESPPEKPYNNNPAINSYGTKPDIVSDEKKLYPNIQPGYDRSRSPYQNENPYSGYNPNTSFDKRSDDLSYGELPFDDRPRSRKPVALSDADYADISMPHV